MTAQERIDQAVSALLSGYSCSQAILSTYGPLLGLERNLALRVSSGFGGGLARTGDVCGVVSGAVMAIGLRYGNISPGEQEKEKIYVVVRAFLQAFKERNSAIKCRDLLGYDVSTPEGKAQIKEKQLAKTICPAFVRDAAEILEKILDGNMDSIGS